MNDYYRVLDVQQDASQGEIKKSFRRLALRYHPDRNIERPQQAEEKFKEINEAYQVLGDEDKRRHYDYLMALTQYKQKFSTKGVFNISFGQTLDEETMQQLLQCLINLSTGFVSGQRYMRGCRRRFGGRCRRWSDEL